jgi:peptidoglycan hydrolase-like protein with peptidoglycan-binding domain
MPRLHPPALLVALSLAYFLAGCGGRPAANTVPATSAPAGPAVTIAPTQPPLATPAATVALQESTAAPAPNTQAVSASTVAPLQAPPLTRSLLLQEPRLEGDDVRLVQRRLSALGYTEVGAADGIFGPNTEAAVRAFQADNGLDADGVIGPQTWERLFSAAAVGRPWVAPILDAPTGFVLGGTRDGAWLSPAETTASFASGLAFRRYSPSGETGSSVADAAVSVGVPCEQTLVVELAPPAETGEVVAIAGPWNPLPRQPINAADQQAEFREQVLALLRAEGIAEPDLQIRQALRVDLTGNGDEELLVVATRLAEQRTTIAPGDYSLVALLPADRQGAELVVGEFHTAAAEFGASVEYRINGLFDLNGDGSLEIVVGWNYYEGGGTVVYDAAGGQIREVLGAGCGV